LITAPLPYDRPAETETNLAEGMVVVPSKRTRALLPSSRTNSSASVTSISVPPLDVITSRSVGVPSIVPPVIVALITRHEPVVGPSTVVRPVLSHCP